jgi:hypothetical protein
MSKPPGPKKTRTQNEFKAGSISAFGVSAGCENGGGGGLFYPTKKDARSQKYFLEFMQ